jgi:hypothetical protein
MERIFEETNRSQASTWFKFEKVNDAVAGEVVAFGDVPPRDGFAAQLFFTLRLEDGAMVNVGLKKTQYNLDATRFVKVGDTLGVKFEKEIPNKNPRLNPAKSMGIYHVPKRA